MIFFSKKIKKQENLFLLLIFLIMFIGIFFWFNNKLTDIVSTYEENNNWHTKELNEYYSDFNFQSKIEGQKVNSNLKLFLVRNRKYVNYNEFSKKYLCVFYLAEIGCNECYIHEFDIIREILDENQIKKIAVITNTQTREFVIKLIKDYASDFDVYQVENCFFENDNKINAPFFMQLNDDRLCYNVHKSSKMFQKLTYLYLDNLKKIMEAE